MEETKNLCKRWKIGAIACFSGAGVILVTFALIVFLSITGRIEHIKLNEANLGINSSLIPQESLDKMKGYTNVAIFGLDNRMQGIYSSGNSDVIIIVSIDNETKAVKLVSVYRDTLLNIGDDLGGLTKCNAAYNRGGPEAAVAMLNSNLDLDIKDFVAVDWNAVTEVIDELDGIELEIDASEINYINFYIDEINDKLGRRSSHVTKAGKQNLDGVQATAYCRIRYTAGGDFRRAMRHRIVLETMLEKAKTKDIATLLSIVNEMADDISTSFELNEMIALAMDVDKYTIAETSGFPFKLTSELIYCGSTDIPLGLAENVSKLHSFLFLDDNYQPSTVVKNIGAEITRVTGYDANSHTDYNMDEFNNTTGKDNAFK